MDYNIQQVAVEEIDPTDTFYQITTSNDIEDICASIRDIGILHAPILIREKETFIIVSGFRRIKAARKIGLDRIPATILDASKETLESAKTAIAANSLQRELNIIEQARAMRLLSGYFPSPDKMIRTAAELNLPSSRSIIEKLLAVSRMDGQITDGMLSDAIALATALEIDKLDDTQKIPVAMFLRSLNISLNIQRELLTTLTEISLREGTAPQQILSEPAVADVLNDPDRDTRQKAATIRRLFRKRRFPELSKAEDDFAGQVKKLKLDSPTLKLMPPKAFEGTTYILQITFNSYPELLERQSQLNAVIDNPIFPELLK